MKTKTVIDYYAIDVTAKSDSSYSIDDKQEFSDVDNLKLNKLAENKYATLEKNFLTLDGEETFMGDSVSVAYWSKTMSDEDGIMQNEPEIEINFTNNVHSSIGITLTFSQYSYASQLTITYYNSSDEVISTKTFEPDNYEYFCEQVVANYKKIKIKFEKTNYPYRYIKLFRILFGKVVEFDGSSLISANLLESVNILSDQITINTLEFSVYSNDDRFNILNPEGVYKTLQERQLVNAYKITENNTIDMGTFYLNSWTSEKDNKMRFTAIDLTGILDNSNFVGGIYADITVENLISQIMTSAGISSLFYEIDNEIKDLELSGYIPICTHRQALQYVLFAIGALSNCARSDKIKIEKIKEIEEPNVIEKSNVLKGTRKIEQGKIVTGVSVMAHQYRQEGSEVKLFEGTLNDGDNTITFNEPVYNLRCTSGTISASGANFVTITRSGSGNTTIYGYKYTHETQTFLVEDQTLTENEKSNILKIEEDYLINFENALDVATRVLNYYKNSYKTNFEFILDDEKPADNVIIEENFDNTLNGYITQLDIDMVGGYITKAEAVAKVSEEDE